MLLILPLRDHHNPMSGCFPLAWLLRGMLEFVTVAQTPIATLSMADIINYSLTIDL
jgi:hypothetical protein